MKLSHCAAALLACVSLTACDRWEKNKVPLQILTPTGLGAVRIGMTVREAERALDMVLYERQSDEPEDCWYTRRKDNASPWILYMIQEGIVVRIDVNPIDVGAGIHFAPPVRTAKSITIDSKEKSIVRRYGSELEITPHPYLEDFGRYMKVLTEDGKHGILFETSEGKVTTFRSGTAEAIRLIEGCS